MRIKNHLLWAMYGEGAHVDEDYKGILLTTDIKAFRIEEIEVNKMFKCEITGTKYCDKLTNVGSNTDPEYQYLLGNKKYYQSRLKNLDGKYRDENTFKNTLKKFKKQGGYNYKKAIIIINQDNKILDGAHRAALICYLNGCDTKIKVLRIWEK